FMGESIAALEKKVAAVLGKGDSGPGAPELSLKRVNGDVATLYSNVDKADAAPTTAQVNATAETERDLFAVMKRWDEVKTVDLPALNRQLRSASLPEIHLESNPQ